MVRVSVIVLLGLLTCGVVEAQTSTTAQPTSVDILVFPPTGNLSVITPIATRTTVIGTLNTSTGVVTPNGQCGRAPAPPATGPIVNPTQVEFDDVFAPGKKCVAFVPPGLPDGSGYRVVAVATAVTCQPSATGPVVTPCPSVRSQVGVPPFGVVSVRTPPVAPTSLVVLP